MEQIQRWSASSKAKKTLISLWSIGIPATCNPGGAGKWRPDFNSLFTGKEVAIFPDNDEPVNGMQETLPAI